MAPFFFFFFFFLEVAERARQGVQEGRGQVRDVAEEEKKG